METLFIRLRQDPAGPVSWCRSDTPERVAQGTLAQAAEAAAGARIAVLVPAVDVSLATAHLPTRQRQRQRQALPFALEEQLASEVEQLHFAVGTSRGDEVHSAVVERALLRRWLATLADAGLKPHALLPDLLALPRSPGEWSLLAEPGGCLLRSADNDGIAFESDALPDLLSLALQQAGDAKPTQLHLYTARGAIPPDPEPYCTAAGVKLVRSEVDTALPLLAPGAATPVINLLQGEFSPREQRGKQWRPWLPVAILAVLLLMMQGGMAIARYIGLEHEQRHLDQAIDNLYRTTFPDAKRIVDARVQMQQKLDALRSGDSGQEFTRLLAAAAPALHGDGIELTSLQYTAGELDVELHADNLQRLDQVKQRLGSAGLHAEITGADSGDKGVTGRLSVRGDAT